MWACQVSQNDAGAVQYPLVTLRWGVGWRDARRGIIEYHVPFRCFIPLRCVFTRSQFSGINGIVLVRQRLMEPAFGYEE